MAPYLLINPIDEWVDVDAPCPVAPCLQTQLRQPELHHAGRYAAAPCCVWVCRRELLDNESVIILSRIHSKCAGDGWVRRRGVGDARDADAKVDSVGGHALGDWAVSQQLGALRIANIRE